MDNWTLRIYEYENGIMIPETYMTITFTTKPDRKAHIGYLDTSAEFVDEEKNEPYLPHEILGWHYLYDPEVGWKCRGENR